MELLRKSVSLELKAADDNEGVIEGYGSVFGAEDDYGDVVVAGAFKDTLKSDRKVRMLWQHDTDKILGVWDELKEDAKGLVCKGRINLETELGRDAYSCIKMGGVDGLSIGFRVGRGGAEWDEEADVRMIKNIQLWEVSVVTFPAQALAMIDDVKSLVSLQDLDTLDLTGVERFLREAGLSREWAKRLMHRHTALVRQREAEEREAADLGEGMQNLLQRLTS